MKREEKTVVYPSINTSYMSHDEKVDSLLELIHDAEDAGDTNLVLQGKAALARLESNRIMAEDGMLG